MRAALIYTYLYLYYMHPINIYRKLGPGVSRFTSTMHGRTFAVAAPEADEGMLLRGRGLRAATTLMMMIIW